MPGISPRLPLTLDGTDVSYSLNKTLKDSIQQNLKHLVLTNPGERIMDSRFGVGIKRFLFETFGSAVSEGISSEIRNQISKYMPFIRVESINISDNADENKLYVAINYSVPSLSIQNILSLDIARSD